MGTVSKEILTKFKSVTKFDITDYFIRYADFVDNDYIKISNFYSGVSQVSNSVAFGNLDALLEESKRVIELFDINARRLTTQDAWILLEQVEIAKESLLTAKNLFRYLRSTVTQSSYTSRIQLSHVAKQGELLEAIERKIAGNNDPDGWTQTAIDSGLEEEDYSNEGGYIAKIKLSNSRLFTLNSVVAGIVELEDAYGRDINRILNFVSDDLEVLPPKDTLTQSAYILTNLKLGDDPFFPERGIDKKLGTGNALSVAYPIIFRQISSTFATDDSFKSVAIKNIKRKGDATEIEIELETQVGDFINESIII